MKRIIGVISIMVLLLIGVSWAQESPLTISDMNIEPSFVGYGDTVIISCRVKHSEGSMYIKRVYATVFYEKRATSYPKLYDDGRNGDREPGDGIYSLEIKTVENSEVAKIVFHAVDNNRIEIDSEPIYLTIQSVQ